MSKPRNMTAKGFLHKSGGKVSAAGFLAEYRNWLLNGDFAQVSSPILAKLDSGEILPTPALDEIRQAVFSHHLRLEALKAEKKLLESTAGEAPSKPWNVRVYTAKGEIATRNNPTTGEVEDLDQDFDTASAADRWADRRLFEGESDNYAVVSSNALYRSDGDPISTVVLRADAIARILKQPKGPIAKKTGTRDNKLSFGVKAVQDRCHFSHG